MDLLIACLLIYGFGLPMWLYPIAVLIFAADRFTKAMGVKQSDPQPLNLTIRGEVERMH